MLILALLVYYVPSKTCKISPKFLKYLLQFYDLELCEGKRECLGAVVSSNELSYFFLFSMLVYLVNSTY